MQMNVHRVCKQFSLRQFGNVVFTDTCRSLGLSFYKSKKKICIFKLVTLGLLVSLKVWNYIHTLHIPSRTLLPIYHIFQGSLPPFTSLVEHAKAINPMYWMMLVFNLTSCIFATLAHAVLHRSCNPNKSGKQQVRKDCPVQTNQET